MEHKCNMENYKTGYCNKRAIWKNERYPENIFCEDHKKTLEDFYPEGWSYIDEDEGE